MRISTLKEERSGRIVGVYCVECLFGGLCCREYERDFASTFQGVTCMAFPGEDMAIMYQVVYPSL